MKRTRDEIIKLAVERLLDLFQAFEERPSNPRRPEPEPPEPQSRREQSISMNEIARSIPKPRPPRAPGLQTRRFNGSWWHY
jgi:hypothetical protein